MSSPLRRDADGYLVMDQFSDAPLDVSDQDQIDQALLRLPEDHVAHLLEAPPPPPSQRPRRCRRLADWRQRFSAGASGDRPVRVVFAAVLVVIVGLVGWAALNANEDSKLSNPADAGAPARTVLVLSHGPGSEVDPELVSHLRELLSSRVGDLSVVVDSAVVPPDDPDRAAELARRYDASFVVWGRENDFAIVTRLAGLELGQADIGSWGIEMAKVDIETSVQEYLQTSHAPDLSSALMASYAQTLNADELHLQASQVAQLAATGVSEPGRSEWQSASYFSLGYALQQLDRNREAIDAYQEALAADPQLADAYYNLGVLYTDTSDYAAAIEALDQTVSLGDRSPEVLIAQASAHLLAGNYDLATAGYDQAVAIDPSAVAARYNRAIAKYLTGDAAGFTQDTSALLGDPETPNELRERTRQLLDRTERDDSPVGEAALRLLLELVEPRGY